MAKSFAFRLHAVDVDQEDSHTNHFVNKLRSRDLIDGDEFSLLLSRARNRESWLRFAESYSGIDRESSKKMFQAFGYGGAPDTDVPFLRKLCQEYRTATRKMLALPENAWTKNYYGDRRHPEMSRLAAVMSFEEDKCMVTTESRLVADSRTQAFVYTYDGSVFECTDARQRRSIEDSLDALSAELNIGIRIKEWKKDAHYSIPVRLFEHAEAKEEDVQLKRLAGLSKCLLNSVLYLDGAQTTWDFSATGDGPYCVRDLNRGVLIPRRRDSPVLFVHRDVCEDLLSPGVALLVHEQLMACQHFFSARVDASGNVLLFDELWGKHLVTQAQCFLRALLETNATVFVQTESAEDVRMDSDAYSLRGGGQRFNPFPAPKRGKNRMVLTAKSSQVTKRTVHQKVSYTRHGVRPATSRNARCRWSTTLEDILQFSEKDAIKHCQTIRLLEKKKGTTCPYCKKGTLGALTMRKDGGRKSYMHRCNHKGCQRRVLPHSGHPIFTTGDGQGFVSCKSQCAALFLLQTGASMVTCGRILNSFGESHFRAMRKNISRQRALYVQRRQKTMLFGNRRTWKDCEADETVFRTFTDHESSPDECTAWEQWAGIVERGNHASLVLQRTKSAMTKSRAPGPGAITKLDWLPMAQRFLLKRKVILHTDRAKSYNLKVQGVLHESVRNCKKRVKIGGKWVWRNPVYVKTRTHILPDGRKLNTKGGTQVIDRAWRFFRKHLEAVNAKPGTRALADAVRSAQWLYVVLEPDR